MSEALDDRSVILRCKQGDNQAYGILVDRYMKRAYYIALGFVGHHDSALDLSQDAFVRAYKAIHKIDEDRSFFTYFYRILRNLCFNFNRDRKRRAQPFSMIGEDTLRTFSDKMCNPDETLEKKELKDAVWKGINSLKPEFREIILLKEFQNFSYQEIADILNIPQGTVMSRLYHARKSLKDKLEGVFDHV